MLHLLCKLSTIKGLYQVGDLYEKLKSRALKRGYRQGLFELKANCYNLKLFKQFLKTIKVSKTPFLQYVQ